MSDERKYRGEVGSSTNDYDFAVPLRRLPREEHLQATSTKLFPLSPVYDMKSWIENPHFLQSQFPFMTHAMNVQTSDVAISSNNAFLNKEPGDHLDFGIASHSAQEVSHGTSGSGFLFSKPIEDVSLMNENPSFLQGYFSSIPPERRTVPSSIATMNGHSFRTHALFESTSEAVTNAHVVSDGNNILQFKSAEDRFVDDLSSFERNTDKQFGNGYSSSDQIVDMRKPMEFFSTGQSENLQNDRILSNGQKYTRMENDFSSSGNGKDQYIPNSVLFDIANQLFAISKENNSKVQNSDFKDDIISFSGQDDMHSENDLSSSESGEYPYIPNAILFDIASKLLPLSEESDTKVAKPDFIDHLSLNEISLKYCQLYTQALPQNYDFAMNIMAYIEILEDCSWKATFTNLDENVKNMVKYFWNELENTVNSNMNLPQYGRSDFLKLIKHITVPTFGQKYNLDKFLKYCVIMCQLGVFVRKRKFKEAPLYVIDVLRKRIREIENCQQIMFEIHIKKYAQNLVVLNSVKSKGEFHHMHTF